MRETQGTENTDDSTELAKDRTDWAEDRTILANERTFAGWMRTGMGCIAVALGLKAVFGDAELVWVAKGIAVFFCIIAVLIFAAAAQQSTKTQDRIHQHDTEAQPSRRMTVISVLLSTGALATGVVLLML